MRCPYCGRIIRNDKVVCPACGGRITADAKRQQTSSPANRIVAGVLFLVVLIPLVMGITNLVRSSYVSLSYTPTKGVVVQTGDTREEVDRQRKGGRNSSVYFVLTVYQQLTVEYTMNGETFCVDLGEQIIYQTDEKMASRLPSLESVTWGYAYEIGDTVEIYASDDGNAFLADAVYSDTKRAFGFVLLGLLLAVLFGKELIFRILKK